MPRAGEDATGNAHATAATLFKEGPPRQRHRQDVRDGYRFKSGFPFAAFPAMALFVLANGL